jgi:exonuclease SbcC
MHKREISIALKVQEIEEAEVGLTEFQRRLMEIQSRINQGDILPSEQEEIKRLEEEIQLLAVDRERHDGVRKDIQAREGFTELKARLFEAQRNLEMESKRLPQIQESLLARERNINRDAQRLEALRSSLPDYSHLERKILEEERAFSDLSLERAERERKIGALEQKLHELSEMVKERGGVERNLSQVREERGIYQELSEAFGKKGIQAFIIESVLPQIEREANHILSRMTEGRMRLEILTQREVKKGGFMETLDINIIDDLGMRSYEMYSGGEAFRINFALRIALSKLLAQRAGAPLSLLIIDEGFGTQDRMGRTRIVEAIKSIEDEFDKIIVITHIEELMEAFPLRIEVQKERGISRISLS